MEYFELVIYAWLCLFGACIGSFLNVVIYRVPRGESIAKGRSHCPACGAQLKWYDLIPVFSWLALRRRCRACGGKISLRYPAVELAGALTAALCYARWWFDWMVPLAFGVCVILLAVALIDLDTMEIPNGLVLALIPFAVGSIWAMPGVTLLERGIGFLAVSLPLLLLAVLIPGSFGGGDIKLMAVCGFLLGWQNTLFAFFAALLIGGGCGIYLLVSKKAARGSHIAFGPALCIGIAAALFYGREAIALYLGFFGL